MPRMRSSAVCSGLSSFGSGGIRAGLLVPFGLEVAAQRSLAARVGARLELLGHLLQAPRCRAKCPSPQHAKDLKTTETAAPEATEAATPASRPLAGTLRAGQLDC